MLWRNSRFSSIREIFVLLLKCSTETCITCKEISTGAFLSGMISNHTNVTCKNYSAYKNEDRVRPSVSDIYKKWCSRFTQNGIPDSDSSSKYIIQYVLGITKAYQFDLNQHSRVSEDQEKQIAVLCECRLARMPVQYIIKEWDFRDLHLMMCPPVFIPRPETEQLVDLVLDVTKTEDLILEVGCGSGAISLSLLKSMPSLRVFAIDQSKLACQLTRKNAELNGLTKNLQVMESKLGTDGSLSVPLPMSQVDVIVSNPPYVPSSQITDLQPEIKLYEDLRALEAGKDGLRVVKSLLFLSQSMLKPGGSIFLEVDSSHPKLIEEWLKTNAQLGIKFVKSVKDYCERNRFVILQKL